MLTSPVLASLDSVVLTVPRASPVALATSPAVMPPFVERALRTLALVAPGGVRTRELLLATAAAGGLGLAAGALAVAAGVERAVVFRGDFDLGLSRGSSAANARRNFSASASNCSRRS